MNKFIVITSIFPPTEAVKKFAAIDGWQLIVVGDKKTDSKWHCKNVIYLSPEDQMKFPKKVVKQLPWNSYCRKIAGYLYAISHGADIIADTDDDNIPYENWGKNVQFEGEFETIKSSSFINIYKQFTEEHIWPRGYPLNKILEKDTNTNKMKKAKVGVWQYLADEDPDVDAIYRLTNNKPIYFKKRTNIILEKGTLCPINSQNTFFRKELFPLLYLPAFVSFRFTDILRGLIAQPLLWQEGYVLGFGSATVIQKRNPHNYLKDFESEIPCYLEPENVISITKNAINKLASLPENIIRVYKALEKEKIVTEEEIKSVSLWLESLS